MTRLPHLRYLVLVALTLAVGSVDAANPKHGPVSVENNDCPKFRRVPLFGAWRKHDGIDTRNQLLIDRSMVTVTMGENGKTVIAGKWLCPYTDSIITDPDHKRHLQIDHIVPLKEAYESGAWSWSKNDRKDYANDPDVLFAVSQHENSSKSDRDVAEYLPPENQEWYCKKWAETKINYGMTADYNEIEALKSCGVPEEDLPEEAPETNCLGE